MSGHVPTAQPRIVVADDDTQLQRLARRALEGAGFEVAQAFSGRELEQQLEQQLPDLILLDVGLADADGRDLLARLKRDPKTKDIAVVVWSGRNAASDRRIAVGLGAEDYLEKGPMSLLVPKLKRLLLKLER